MRDNLKVVARPKGVLQTFMDKGLVCRTGPETADDCPLGPVQLATRGDWAARCDPYVSSFIDRIGKRRFRFRRKGMKNIYMPHPDSPEYPAAYAAAMKACNCSIPDTKKGFCYFIGARDVGVVKIGHAKDVAMRLNHLQVNSPVEVELMAAVDGGLWRERKYHIRFADDRVRGEWFRLSPRIVSEIERLSNG